MASGSSSSYRRRARSPTTGDMVERQRRRRFEQVLGGAALSLALPDPPAPVSRLMDFSRRPWNVFGAIEAARADDAAAGPPRRLRRRPLHLLPCRGGWPLPRCLTAWTSKLRPRSRSPVSLHLGRTISRRGAPARRHLRRPLRLLPCPGAWHWPLPRRLTAWPSSKLRPRGRSPVASCPAPTMPRRGTSARRHPHRTWIHYDRGKHAPSAASPRASLRHSANHAGSSSKT